MSIPPALITLLVGMALVLAGLWVGTNVDLLPQAASANAPVYDDLFKVLFSIGTILFLGITGLLIFSLIKFRRRPGDRQEGMAIEGNLPLEIVWTAIPAIVVLFIGIYSYDIYDRMGGMAPLDHSRHIHNESSSLASGKSNSTLMYTDNKMSKNSSSVNDKSKMWGGIGIDKNSGSAPFVIDVKAMQFAFIFHYPESNITTGELHIPANRPVELHMEAQDVIHAFWVPQFRLKQDVIPGQPTVLAFIATVPGHYPIVCAELCGPYHGGMRSSVVVQEAGEFEDWIFKNAPDETPATVAQSLGSTASA